MKKYKLSRYNWVISRNSFLILYNGFTDTLARVDDADRIGRINPLFSGTASIEEVNRDDSELFDFLVHGGFLIPAGFDEREYFRLQFNRNKYSGIVAITAVVTTGCNFKCTYCYEELESRPAEVMDTHTADAIVDYCRQIGAKSVFVTLYGGEPLLNKEVCIYLINAMQKLEDCKIGFHLITNGYLLDEATAVALSGMGVKSVQITLDGSREVHNSQRMLKDGSGTYEVVVKNIISAARHMKVQVRVNIGRNSAEAYDYIKELFKDKSAIFVYPAAIQDYANQKCAAPDHDFMAEIIGADKVPVPRIKAKQPGCIATNMTGMVVLPDGQIVKCWREVTSWNREAYRMPYGIDIRSINMINREWEKYNPYNSNNKCYQCKMLPSCGGGCPYEHVINNTHKCKYTEAMYMQYIERMYQDKMRELKG
jgi:uncharacterized protein